MDIYLSTSEFEGLPIAMLEAMSCEVPVVATRAGGIGEVIQHGKQGYLTEIEEWEELEKYCVELLQNPQLQQQMALVLGVGGVQLGMPYQQFLESLLLMIKSILLK